MIPPAARGNVQPQHVIYSYCEVRNVCLESKITCEIKDVEILIESYFDFEE